MTYPQSHPKHCEDDLVSRRIVQPAEIKQLRADMERDHPDETASLILPDDVAEHWQLNYALGQVVAHIWHVASEDTDNALARMLMLDRAKYYLDREIERERKLRE